MRPKVVVSNATRLHAHQHAFALQRAGMLKVFATSLWDTSECSLRRFEPWAPKRIQLALRSFLNKRSHAGIDPLQVHQIPWTEYGRLSLDMLTLGRLREEWAYLHKTLYDQHIARKLREWRPDVFVGYEISCARSFAAAKRLGATTVLDLAAMHYAFVVEQKTQLLNQPSDDWITRKLCRRKQKELDLVDHVICISQLSKRILMENGFPSERVTSVPLGADLATFRPSSKNRESGLSLLYVGNISRMKGIPILLSAVRQLGLPNVRVTLVGSFADRDVLRSFEGMYHYVPYLNHSELALEYQKADVFVLPSLLDGWGMVVNEAMASGTPVIVTDNVGSKELVDSETGWIVRPGDVNSLATAIAEAYRNAEQLQEMGRKAAAAVRDLTWDRYHDQIAKTILRIWQMHQPEAPTSKPLLAEAI